MRSIPLFLTMVLLGCAGQSAGRPEPASPTSMVRALRVEPSRVELKTGDTFDFRRALRVFAYDASGQLIGRLRVYDHHITGRAAYVWNFRVIADARGESVLTITVPHWQEGDGDPPSADVLFVVRDP